MVVLEGQRSQQNSSSGLSDRESKVDGKPGHPWRSGLSLECGKRADSKEAYIEREGQIWSDEPASPAPVVQGAGAALFRYRRLFGVDVHT